MSTFPFFFVAPPTVKQFQDIDAYDLIRRLRDITDLFVQKYVDTLLQGFNARSIDVLQNETPAGPLDIFINTHMSSLGAAYQEAQTPSNTKHRLRASWSGITAASAIYLCKVVGIWHTDRPIDRRLHRRLLLILKRDMQKCEKCEIPYSESACYVSFWMTFTAAFSLANAAMDYGMRDTYLWFCSRIRSWGKINGVSLWSDARAILASVVWPASHPEDMVAERLWDASVYSQ